ncbi:MAG TPA: Nif3-like dinuclear metal center hexameric protein [Aliicoccus persicus]|uniref:GTP cyclohydrolase 1 type 2 homolog n=1 Tax=Aliicoccus persicus TaxID=930138 RepID=A0A921DZG5_9STAP|nr:Nif3-like dinuclear metal center hexameric protein [Aliicoccus persicus]
MKVNDLLNIVNNISPLHYGESWDNNGLLVGDEQAEVTGILTTLDCHPDVVKEAIDQNINVIVSHHPLIFSKLSKVTEDGIGSIIRTLIKHDINLISIHTPLDFQPYGVSNMIAKALGFNESEVLIKQTEDYQKLRVNVPKENVEAIKTGLAKVGVGNQGDYSECFFEYPVQGQFRPNENANPHIGKNNELEVVEEYIVEAIFPTHLKKQVIEQLYQVHPYEEPAFDVLTLEREIEIGLGVKVSDETTLDALVEKIKVLEISGSINLVRANDAPIKSIGIIGGSGMSYVNDAFKAGIDVLITGDVKYHEAYDAKLNKQNIIDAGHFIEVVMMNGLKDLLEDKVSGLPVKASRVNTNPFE